MTLCLTKPELIELTGYQHRKRQMEALTYMQIDFRVTPAGDVKVLRSELDSRGGKGEEPDYAAI